MYKCLECGSTFDEGKIYEEAVGKYGDAECYESHRGCPMCGGDYEELYECEICGAEILAGESNGGVCEECIENHGHDIDVCVSIGKASKDEIKINSFLACVFSENDIEMILIEHLKKHVQLTRFFSDEIKAKIKDYIESDKDWFGEMLAKEVNKK